MRFPRPRSLNGLVLTGFALVALPLLFAVSWALYKIDGFSNQSQTLIAGSTEATVQSGLLIETLKEMQRSAGQYQVLEEDDLLGFLAQDMAKLTAQLGELIEIVPARSVASAAGAIGRKARNIEKIVRTKPPGTTAGERAITGFGELVLDAEALQRAVNDEILAARLQLREDAARAQRTLTWQTIAIVPVTLGVVLIFTLLIGRPIRQLDRAIRQLGQSGFAKNISVRGPADLEALGQQLEWLRVRLLELAQEKNRFLRHMSHELKTPLANIREGTDLLLDGTVGDLEGSQQEVATILRSNGLKLQRLIENLLSFSAWQTKNEKLMLSNFNLLTLIENVIKGHRLTLNAQKISIHVDSEPMQVDADREKMRTVLDNLISNAVKFTPRNGDIYVNARREKRSLVIDVADTGEGIAPGDQTRIFDPFFQGQAEESGLVAGTGIGLSVVMECVEAHGGTAELITGQYKGAHFRVHIPQEDIELQLRLAANA